MKILLLTTLYALPGEKILNNTNVCGSFAKEWVKMGHEVRVIYQYTIYHQLFHWIAKRFSKQIADHLYGAVAAERITKINRYMDDGVEVIRIPMYKKAPRMLYSDKTIKEHIRIIMQQNSSGSFVPDVIIGHFFYPNIQIVASLKDFYPDSKTCIVVHLQGINIKKTKNQIVKVAPDALSKINIWGYRSRPIKHYFERAYGSFDNYFYCYSGVPSKFVEKEYVEKDMTDIRNFIYVGALIKRKHPSDVLESLDLAEIDDFELHYVGEGQQRRKIEDYARNHGLSKNVYMHGYIKREQISDLLDKSQVFVMISSNETFGLVYLEAMARGCIVIASRNEGMDGIVQDGENGFLCEAGNKKELALILYKIVHMPIEDLRRISRNARATAVDLTDEKVARNYLNAVSS